MVSKKKIDPLKTVKSKSSFIFASILLATLFLLLAKDVSAISSPASYFIKPQGKALIVSFSSPWALDEIVLPTVSAELWSIGQECRAAVIEVAGRQFISSTTAKGRFMRFRPEGIASDSFVITPLIVAETSQRTSENPRITFTGVPAEIRAIENKIVEITGKVSRFHTENRCFSCHTALPLAMVYRAAVRPRLKH